MQAKLKVEKFEDRVSSVLSRLPNGTGRERFWGVYVSLLMAESHGYSCDEFRQHRPEDRCLHVSKMTQAVLSNPTTWDDVTREWVAGYYFNNSLLRMAALAEISIKDLFQKITSLSSSPNDYWWLADWYEKKCNGEIQVLNRTRQEVNAYKHGRKDNGFRKLEKMSEGIKAFSELLVLLERLAETNK